jgi:hypothetical protein
VANSANLSTLERYFAALTLLCFSAPVLAQDTLSMQTDTKSVEIGRGTAPTLDGLLDEADWASATLVEDFHQVEPIEYSEPTEDMSVRIYYDETALYIGARMPDSRVDQLRANVLRQGAQFWGDDYFSVVIAPFNDKRNGYRFQLNPNGIRMEMLFYDVSGQDWDWNGIWQGAASIDDEGWTAEIAIPFNTVSFNPSNDTWGINFQRDLSRLNESIGWVSRNASLDPSISGEAVGFENLELGAGLDVVPSVALIQRRSFNPGSDESSVEPQLDVFYRLTPSLNASLTLNTDFSATEVDDRQVNLTRFGLFFSPELAGAWASESPEKARWRNPTSRTGDRSSPEESDSGLPDYLSTSRPAAKLPAESGAGILARSPFDKASSKMSKLRTSLSVASRRMCWRGRRSE